MKDYLETQYSDYCIFIIGGGRFDILVERINGTQNFAMDYVKKLNRESSFQEFYLVLAQYQH